MAAEEFQILNECLTRINHSVIQNLFRLFFLGFLEISNCIYNENIMNG